MTERRLNSLFSGGGTFDHGAALAGWQTVSLCEFDPEAQDVLAAHHPGTPIHPDIRNLKGGDLPDAELVMGGSPCQSLSNAGRRKGIRIDSLDAYLAHRDDPELQQELSASSLYWEMVRVIQEKYAATDNAFPRFVLWENVPGAFSSAKGEDFRIVLSGFLGRDVPLPRSGRWQRAGVVRAGGREIAWRTLDSQHFGVPQRRKRIFLVVDLGGHRASEILFERQGVSGCDSSSARQGQDAAPATGAGTDASGEREAAHAIAFALRGREGGAQAEVHGDGSTCGALRAANGGSSRDYVATRRTVSAAANPSFGLYKDPTPKYGLEIMPCLRANRTGGTQTAVAQALEGPEYIVRRLTPTEQERLQALPDGFTSVVRRDGKPMPDGSRYRICGNGGTATVIQWVLARTAAALAIPFPQAAD